MDPLQVAEEEVLESSSNRFEDIYRFLVEGSFPASFCSIKRKNLKRYALKFIIQGGCLYYVGSKKDENREVVVNPERRHQIFLECHFTEAGHHLGQKKTVNRIQSRYYWLGIVKDVVDWIKICEVCQISEQSKIVSNKIRHAKIEVPWDALGLDVYGPFPETAGGNAYVLTMADYFSKWIEAVPLQRKDALSVAKALAKTFYRFGAAKHIYSILSLDFCDEVSRHLRERWNIIQTIALADPSSYTGLDDRTNELLKSSIRSVVSAKPRDWDEHMEPVLFEFRTSVNPVTKYTPFFLMFNRDFRVSSEVQFGTGSVEQGVVKRNALPTYSAGVQEQQKAVKEIVTANLAAAYKKERKGIKHRTRSLPSLTLKSEDDVFRNNSKTPAKEQKNQLVPFQNETACLPIQSASGREKTSSRTEIEMASLPT